MNETSVFKSEKWNSGTGEFVMEWQLKGEISQDKKRRESLTDMKITVGQEI